MQIVQSIKENISILYCAEMLGYHPVQCRGNQFRWSLKEHDSLVINLDSNGRQRFIWNSRGIHGSVIDFYMAMTGVDQKKAIQDLGNTLKEKSVSCWNSFKRMEQIPPKPAVPQDLQLPEFTKDCRRMYAYLCQTRKIDAQIVTALVKQRLLYQDTRGNVVFTGKNPETDKIEYACLRGTLSDKQYRGEVLGSKKEVGFQFHLGENPTKVFVCESPIDAMSVASILLQYHCSLEQYIFLSLGGTSVNALRYHLEKNPQINMVYLCQDNDAAGEKSRQKARETLEEMGFAGKIIDKLPQNKDFNEDLIALKQTLISPKQPIAQTQALAIG